MTHASFVLIKNTGAEASVKFNLWEQESNHPQIVKLKKLPAGWRIDAIVWGGKDFDSLRNTMEKAYKQQKK